jgi:uncharacterized protein (DUF1330 family)
MPSAYIIVDMKISDPDRYAQYMAAAPALVHAAGGEYLVRGGRHSVLEGEWQPTRMALLRFPGLEAAQAFYDSQSYRQVRTKREGATEFFDMVVVEGVAEPV